MEPNRICPKCRVEYIPRAQVCADCGSRLDWVREHGEQPLPASLAEAGWDAVGPGQVLGQLTADHEDVIKVYLGNLRAAGIRGAVLPETSFESRAKHMNFALIFGNSLPGGKSDQVPVGDVVAGFRYMLFVGRDDFARADEVIGEVFGELHPGQEMGLNREFELGACPACGFGLEEEATACPDCGLSF